MKTNLFNITALALIITTSFIGGHSIEKSNRLIMAGEAITEMAEINTSSHIMTSAKIINGEVVPVIELPELTIEANYNDTKMVKAKVINGEVMPVVYLPELTITSN
jgi:hypothetical protein